MDKIVKVIILSCCFPPPSSWAGDPGFHTGFTCPNFYRKKVGEMCKDEIKITDCYGNINRLKIHRAPGPEEIPGFCQYCGNMLEGHICPECGRVE